MTTPAAGSPRLESPDGHRWSRDVDHQRSPRSPLLQGIFERAFTAGFATAFERVGAPLRGAAVTHVEGWTYLRMVPAGAPDRPGAGVPPRLLLSILTRLHPELRRRNRQARQALTRKVWLADVAAWWDERPSWESRFRRRQDLDLAGLDDAELAAELEAAFGDAEDMLRRHFELVTPAVGVGLALLAAAADGAAPAAVAERLRGASRSTSEPVRRIDAIAAALTAAGRSTVPDTLDELRAVSPEVDALVAEHLATHGWRVLDDDVTSATLAERPDVLLRAVAHRSAEATPERSTASVPERSPELAEAGRCYEVLDDNSGMVSWSLGVLRRLVLAAGERLVARGALEDAGHVVAVDPATLVALVRGGGPGSDAVAAEARRWAAQHELDPPRYLGGDPVAPPDPGVFPGPLATVAAAIGTYLSLRFGDERPAEPDGRVLVDGRVVATGSSVGTGRVEGRTVVATSAEDALARLEPGDILVCEFTTPAFNAVFPVLGAVVTAVGGPFSHAGVTARELGLPAVVGVGDLSGIPDGVQLVVELGPGAIQRPAPTAVG